MKRSSKVLFHLLIVVALLAAGILGMGALKANKKQIKRQKPAAPLPLVRVVPVETSERQVRVHGEGTVRPLKEIDIVPQVGGKIVYVSPSLVNGGGLKKGDLLLRIDPVDYELAVTLAKAQIKDAESVLKTTQEEAAAGREEWHLQYSKGRKKDVPPLVAKEPQLMAARARLEARKADLKKALLNLGRTEVRAPFNGRISQESAGLGQYVSPGQRLGTLFSTDAVQVVLPLEGDDLYWFHVPGFTPGNGPGAKAVVRARVAGMDRSWEGSVVRTQGELDEKTRMVNVVVQVDRPYEGKPPLAVGSFVTVDILGRTLEDAAVIPRAALRPGDIVWVVAEETMHFRKVDVALFEGDKAVLRSGLESGEQVAVSTIKAPTDGMKVRSVSAGEKTS
jgi:RND family efflux transporter MFP subunit